MPDKKRALREVLERVSLRVSRFKDALVGTTDDAMAVVFGHAYVHFQLQEIVEYNVPNPNAFGDRGINYANLVSFAVALNAVPNDLEQALRKLGDYRNKYAHRIDFDLSAAHRSSFYAMLPLRLRKTLGVSENPMRAGIRELSDALSEIGLKAALEHYASRMEVI
jgi:hypothetical protein